MKTYLKLSLILFLSIFALSFSVQAKEYAIPELRIEVQINEDGTVTITEHRTYVFDGSYSWANYRLPKSGYSALRDIQVLEGDQTYTNLNTEEPGTFLVEESDEDFNLKWFYSAEDEERVFTIRYTLEGAVVIGQEWSEFFWIYAAEGRERSTELIEIVVELPSSVAEPDLHSWIREPAWEMQTDVSSNGYMFSGEEINRRQAVSIRTVFPTDVFNQNTIQVSDPDFSLQQAEEEEIQIRQQRLQKAEEEARLKGVAWELIPILGAISIIGFIFLYRKYGSRHRISLSTNESIMLPGREKPALIGWLLNNRTVGSNLIIATLLDLARQGYFTVKENEPEKEGWLASKKPYYSIHRTEKSNNTQLAEIEQDLLDFVTKRIQSKGNKMEDIFKFSESEVYKWVNEWGKKVKNRCEEKEWIDAESYKGLYWNLALQILLLIVGTVGIFMIHPIMVILMGISFVGIILSFLIIRRTPKGEEMYQRWSNYRKGIKNAKSYSISDDLLGLHFIYAITFGVGKKPIKALFEQNPDAIPAIYWIVILPSMQSSPAEIASSFSNLAATGTATAGGGSIGGGASAGAAGGGASGGAG